jgi:hypothetical protein
MDPWGVESATSEYELDALTAELLDPNNDRILLFDCNQ